MKKEQTQTAKPSPAPVKPERTQCHFFSNTHWDREWQTSMQRTRHMLCYLMDMIVDILQKDPSFKCFNLDSQTVPLLDYLEIRPERAELVRKLVRERRLIVGPWFTLPDQYTVGGESLIRNLQLGHRIAKDFGGGYVPKTGYSPFGWGHTSQMPQIYKGFGIDFMAFYRGINSDVAPKAEFIWEAPDGSRVVGSRLGTRARYNAWYIIHHPVLFGYSSDCRDTRWSEGQAPFRFINADREFFFNRYAHQKHGYNKELIGPACEQALREQDADWRTPHRFWANGHDLSCPDYREAQMVRDCAEYLKGRADVFFSDFEAFQKSVKKYVSDDWPVARGEMRHYMKVGDKFGYIGGLVISTRTWLKQHNFRAERALNFLAEPLTVFASLIGAEHPRGFLNVAWQKLLENHGHDSIGGCHRDIISADIHNRLDQVEEISMAVMEKAMVDLAGAIDLRDRQPNDVALVVYNPASAPRTEIERVVVELPAELKADTIQIVDEKGKSLRTQMVERREPWANNVYIPNDLQMRLRSTRFLLDVEFQDVPGFGYRTFFAQPVVNPPQANPQTMLNGAQTMENEFLRVTIQANGTYDVFHKKTGRLYAGLGFFRDSSENGSPHEHIPVQNDQLFTTLNERAEVVLVRDGALDATFRVTLNWALPDGITGDKKNREPHLKPYPVVNLLTLRQGQPWLDVVTEIDNNVEFHYLRVAFPSQVKTDFVDVQGHYDVHRRAILKDDFSKHTEAPEPEQPMNSFLDLSDGKAGLAILNEGLKAYEAHDDAARTLSITLLRCFSMALGWTFPMPFGEREKGSQNPGAHRFHYAVLPHAGDWAAADLWSAADRFNLPLQAGQIGPSRHGVLPRTASFLELDPANLHVSAIKQSENGKGWIVRVFNPFDRAIKSRLRFNGGRASPKKHLSPVELQKAEFALPGPAEKPWSKVRLVTLEEKPLQELAQAPDGWVAFEITKKKILTFEFLP